MAERRQQDNFSVVGNKKRAKWLSEFLQAQSPWRHDVKGFYKAIGLQEIEQLPNHKSLGTAFTHRSWQAFCTRTMWRHTTGAFGCSSLCALTPVHSLLLPCATNPGLLLITRLPRFSLQPSVHRFLRLLAAVSVTFQNFTQMLNPVSRRVARSISAMPKQMIVVPTLGRPRNPPRAFFFTVRCVSPTATARPGPPKPLEAILLP